MNPIEAGARAYDDEAQRTVPEFESFTTRHKRCIRAAAIAMVGALTEQGTHPIRRVAFEPFCAELIKRLTED